MMNNAKPNKETLIALGAEIQKCNKALIRLTERRNKLYAYLGQCIFNDKITCALQISHELGLIENDIQTISSKRHRLCEHRRSIYHELYNGGAYEPSN